MSQQKIYVYAFQDIEKYMNQKDPVDFIIPSHHAHALGAPLIAAMGKLLSSTPHHRLWAESETPFFRIQLQRHKFTDIIDMKP